MSRVPDNLKYTQEHEWIEVHSDNTATIGITAYAQESLGDITFVDLPEMGQPLCQGDTFGVVESVKAASDLYMPISGEVIKINERLQDAPEIINADPYKEGWIVKILVGSQEELASLLSPAAYKDLTGEVV